MGSPRPDLGKEEKGKEKKEKEKKRKRKKGKEKEKGGGVGRSSEGLSPASWWPEAPAGWLVG